jgi:hypothetical protein
MWPKGQVDWIAKLGNRAFRLRPSQFWNEDPINPKNRLISSSVLATIENSAKKFVETRHDQKHSIIGEI